MSKLKQFTILFMNEKIQVEQKNGNRNEDSSAF